MKMVNKIIGVFVLFLFFSCTKDAYVSTAINANQSQSIRQSTIRPNDVVAWLQAKAKASSSPEKINRILDQLLISRLYAENYNEKENLIIVPMSAQKPPKSSQKLNTRPLEVLLLVEDKMGKIRTGDIVHFYPKKEAIRILPAGFFKTFFEDQALMVDGKFQLKTLEEADQFEMYFNDGKPVEFKVWRATRRVSDIAKNTTCVDWDLVTSYYESDGNTHTVRKFLYSDCPGSSNDSRQGTR